jgi:hypothetical protein
VTWNKVSLTAPANPRSTADPNRSPTVCIFACHTAVAKTIRAVMIYTGRRPSRSARGTKSTHPTESAANVVTVAFASIVNVKPSSATCCCQRGKGTVKLKELGPWINGEAKGTNVEKTRTV